MSFNAQGLQNKTHSHINIKINTWINKHIYMISLFHSSTAQILNKKEQKEE